MTLCDPMDCSLPGSSIHGILQERILEWVSIFFLQGIFLTQGSNSCLLHWQAGSLPLAPPGKPRSLLYNSMAQKGLVVCWCQPLSKTPKACKQLTNKTVINLSERRRGRIHLYMWQNSNYETLEVKDSVYAGWTKEHSAIEMCISIKQIALLPLLCKAHLFTSLD